MPEWGSSVVPRNMKLAAVGDETKCCDKIKEAQFCTGDKQAKLAKVMPQMKTLKCCEEIHRPNITSLFLVFVQWICCLYWKKLAQQDLAFHVWKWLFTSKKAWRCSFSSAELHHRGAKLLTWSCASCPRRPCDAITLTRLLLGTCCGWSGVKWIVQWHTRTHTRRVQAHSPLQRSLTHSYTHPAWVREHSWQSRSFSAEDGHDMRGVRRSFQGLLLLRHCRSWQVHRAATWFSRDFLESFCKLCTSAEWVAWALCRDVGESGELKGLSVRTVAVGVKPLPHRFVSLAAKLY